MTEFTINEQMRRIEAYCSHIERLAFTIPPPNRLCTELVSAAISIRTIALEIQSKSEDEAAEQQYGELMERFSQLPPPRIDKPT